MESKTKYLIVKGSGGGGLGDRIRSVLTGIIYAKITQRTIYIDWSDAMLVPDNRNIFNHLFHLKDVDHVSHCPVSDDVFPPVWRGKLHASLDDQYQASELLSWDRQAVIEQFSFDQQKLDYSQQILVMWEFDQLDKFSFHYSEESGNALMRAVAADYLVVNKPIRQAIQKFKQLAFLSHEIIIAVHIRATNEFKQQKSAVKLEGYISQIKHCMRGLPDQTVNGHVKIFLATDNSDVEYQLQAEFPGQLVTREKWFAAPGERIHFNKQCPDAEESLRDAIIEIYLLAESNYLIYQYNSSFGMVADYFFIHNENNICPLVPDFGLMAKIKNKLKNLI